MYSDGYDLGLVDPAADAARAQGYADCMDESAVTLLGRPLRPGSVVEFGAGTGALLEDLARRWQLREALGFEAASQLVASAGQRDQAQATIRQGYAEEALGEIAGRYDLCLSVNVLSVSTILNNSPPDSGKASSNRS